MRKRDYPTNPDHPGFPHGTRVGYNLGCRTACPSSPTCTGRHNRARKCTLWRAMGMLPPADTDMTPAEPIRAHVTALLEIPDVTNALITELSEVSARALYNVANGVCPTVRVGTARRLLSVSPADVRARLPRPNCPRFVQLIRSMQVQGFSMGWQAIQLGHNPSWMDKVVRQHLKYLSAKDADALEALARRLESKRGPYVTAAGKARAAGWHPLLAYDDDGNLIPEAVRDESIDARIGERDRLARERLDVLRLSLVFHLGPREIETRIGVTGALTQKIRAEAGLRFYLEDVSFTPGMERRSLLRPECVERGAEIRAALEDFFGDPLADPYEAAKRIGLLKAAKYDRLDQLAKSA